MVEVPSIKLNNGYEVPMIGLGTLKSKPEELTQAVKEAIDLGYRHLDCAYMYENEREVGAGIASKIAEGVIKREDLFVTSKLWNTFHKPELVECVLKESLVSLGLDYLDLYLIHWPTGYKEGGELFPKNAGGKTEYSDVDYLDTWAEMERMVAKGFTKSIGVSNFNSNQLDRLLKVAKIKPVMNQIECHPYLNQKKLMEYCKSKYIAVTAYCPLGSGHRPGTQPGELQLLEDARLKAIADKYKKSPAQVVLRYQVQRGNIPIPKSVTRSRIIENIDIFNFQLSADDIAQIDTFDCNGRICKLTSGATHKYYPF